jgi:succinate dehydrogenase / fumarate reductase flavoprotein subunit
MEKYDPERMELSTRDRVALANYTEIIQGRGGPNGGVFLDISHRGKDYILEKLPRMYRQFMEAQMLDISKSPMEVAPTAHYSMGGVIVEPETHATNVQGLFAVGEVTGGLHGANRLGGNSLAETVIFGRRAGEAAAEYSKNLSAQLRAKQAIAAAHDDLDNITREGKEMARPLQRELRNIMWELCGVVRKEEDLTKALSRIEALKEAAQDVDVRPSSEGYQDLAVALDLRGALTSAEATVRSAIERRESRGAHQRTDYPDMNPELNLNFIIERDANGNLTVGQTPVPPVPDELQSWMENEEALTVSGRLLE